jgi:hypothetical protein
MDRAAALATRARAAAAATVNSRRGFRYPTNASSFLA